MSSACVVTAVKNQLAHPDFFGFSCSESYRILEGSDACCLVVELGGGNWAEQSFGGEASEWDYEVIIRAFSKDLSDPDRVGNRIPEIIDKAASSIQSDVTFGEAVNRVTNFQVSNPLPPDGIIEAGGQLWREARITLNLEYWPDCQ